MALGISQIANLGQIQTLEFSETAKDSQNDTIETQLDALFKQAYAQESVINMEDVDIESACLDIENKECEKEILDCTENPENKMYSVQEFVVDNQGMCGMGMGMGSFGDKKVSLTGKELSVLSSVMGAVDTSKEAPTKEGVSNIDDILTALKTQGVSEARISEDGKSIELPHKDGSVTKIYDANGNGMLDAGDYNFNAALSDFQNDLAKYEEKIQKVDKEIEKIEQTKEKHEDLKNNAVENKNEIEAKIETKENENESIESDIDSITKMIIDLEEQNKEDEAKNQDLQLNSSNSFNNDSVFNFLNNVNTMQTVGRKRNIA